MQDDEELRGTIPFEDVELDGESDDDLGSLLESVDADERVESMYDDESSRSERRLSPSDQTVRRTVPEHVAREAKPTDPELEAAETNKRKTWEVAPPDSDAPAPDEDRPVDDEKTRVRKVPRAFRKETRIHRLEDPAPPSHWEDTHAVVEEGGALRIPPKLAARLEPGDVIEIRIASTFLLDEE